MQFNRWLKELDTRLDVFSSCQDAFLERLGVKRDSGGGHVDEHRKV